MECSSDTTRIHQNPTPPTQAKPGSLVFRRGSIWERLRSEPPEEAEPVKATFTPPQGTPAGPESSVSAFARIKTALRGSRGPTESSLVGRLEDGYASAGVDLLAAASSRLGASHQALTLRMESLSTDDASFLRRLSARRARIAGSLSSSCAEYEYSDLQTGETRVETVNAGKLVSTTAKKVTALEGEVEELWHQWTRAQRDVKDIYDGLLTTDGGPGEKETVDMLKKDMAKFEAELDGLVKEMMQTVKESEQGFLREIRQVLNGMLQQMMMTQT
ncbi:hypothetical protein NKR23_g847 [Pleurostoma richardsiae]|uniref:Uncharacterized protein n=1 Tax=Pleurostoma richardsiae TaxID=41990 RepID=A0AA38VPG7_9PEZI|nr:hypothetical protein NKR23_g847 [Pleurostoma richardsiae]